MNPLLPGAPMPEENPTTDFFLFLKKKGFTKHTTPQVDTKLVKDMPLAMKSHWMRTPKYSFRMDAPAMTAVPLPTPEVKSNKLVYIQVLLFVLLIALGAGLYFVMKHIKDLNASKTAIPRNITILRDSLIASLSVAGFALIVSFFF